MTKNSTTDATQLRPLSAAEIDAVAGAMGFAPLGGKLFPPKVPSVPPFLQRPPL